MKSSLFGSVLILLACIGWVSAQSLNDESSKATAPAGWAKTPDSTQADSATNSPSASTSQPSSTTTDNSDSASLTANDFLIDGVPYAKVLYLEGKVWIRQPDDDTFHQLTEDEPIAEGSVIYTGASGILDFATGPGMATRMVPKTLIRIAGLPQPDTLSTPSATTPEASSIGIRKGTIFSALGRSDQAPIEYEVKTPTGVASARGTMFATTADSVTGQSQVSMLHGTVNFKTPDNQTSQITAGQSQQISGFAGGKFKMGPSQTLKPTQSDEFFNHAGGLLEHASGYGVVRRGLGPDVARTLHEHGYALPAATQQRFQNAGKAHYTRRPAFNNERRHPAEAGAKPGAEKTPYTHPETQGQNHPSTYPNHPAREKPKQDQWEKQPWNKSHGKHGLPE